MKKLIALMMPVALSLSLMACTSNTPPAVNEDTEIDTATEVVIGGDPDTWGPDLEEDTDETDLVIGGDPDTWGPDLEEDSVEIPSPITEFATLEEAAAAAGFSITLPTVPEEYTEVIYSVYDLEEGKMIEITWLSDEDTLTLRKQAAGADASDISGVYTEFDTEQSVEANGSTLTLKGEGDTFFVAIWNDGTYNLSLNSFAGMASDAYTAMQSEIV